PPRAADEDDRHPFAARPGEVGRGARQDGAAHLDRTRLGRDRVSGHVQDQNCFAHALALFNCARLSGRSLSMISAVVATSAYLAAMSNRFTACEVAQRSYTASCGTKARKL